MPDTVQVQCRNYLITEIQGLNLTQFESSEIVARDKPSDWERVPRGISIVMAPELEGAGTNGRDDYGYPFLIVISRGNGKSWDEQSEVLSTIRVAIRQKFNNKRPATINEVYIVGVRNDAFLENRPWKDNRAVSVLVAVFWSREVRT